MTAAHTTIRYDKVKVENRLKLLQFRDVCPDKRIGGRTLLELQTSFFHPCPAENAAGL